MLIAVLFMQQAIKGVVQEFRIERCAVLEGGEAIAPNCVEYLPAERIVNGLWATILAVGTVLTCLLVQTARKWRLFRVRYPQTMRGFLV